MLEHLRRKIAKTFSANADNPVAEATNQSEEVSMTTTTEQLNTANETAELVAQLASSASALTELQSQFAELSTKYAEAQAALAQLSEVKEAMVAQAAAEKLAKRKESLEHAVGTVKAAELLATLEVLDDAAFDSVVSAMTVNLDAEASSTAFKETGVVAEADKAEVDPVKALAEGFAAKFKTK